MPQLRSAGRRTHRAARPRADPRQRPGTGEQPGAVARAKKTAVVTAERDPLRRRALAQLEHGAARSRTSPSTATSDRCDHERWPAGPARRRRLTRGSLGGSGTDSVVRAPL